MQPISKKFTYIDLFAGCGGLSLGLEKAGGVLVLGVERSEMASETFFHNFIDRNDFEYEKHLAKSPKDQIERGLLVGEVAELLKQGEILDSLEKLKIDLVAGGPPCQGFSLAGKRNPADKRNQLPWQFLTVVEKIRPKMVVIENVVGMRHKFSKEDNMTVFEQLVTALRETEPGYKVQTVQVDACHYGAPQHRPRLMIIGVRNDIASANGIETTDELWVSNFSDELPELLPRLAPRPNTKSDEARTVGNALADLLPVNLRAHWSHSQLLSDQTDGSNWGLPKASQNALENQKPRSHNPITRKRFGLYQYFADQKINPRVLSAPNKLANEDLELFLKRELSNCRYPAKNRLGELLARDEQELIDLIVDLKTNKHSQRVLELSSPARTVVTIGDDYVHPLEPRVFTVRELARFQGFPNDFIFKAKETTGGQNRKNEVPQYSQVGNAVSPYMAFAVGLLVSEITNLKTS